MDEIIVQIARAVACRSRLRLLSVVAQRGQTTPTMLARELSMPLDAVCQHLRRLSAVGLIQRRHSGRWCLCIARSPYSERTLNGRLARWLFVLLRKPQRGFDRHAPDGVADSSKIAPSDRLHVALFDAFTAFTNLRRLQILRFCLRGKPTRVEGMTGELKMSVAAVSRHTGKLVRRGYLRADREGHFRCYRLRRTFKSPVHARLFELLRPQLKNK